MKQSFAHQALSLPELLLWIAQSLDQFDITVCLRVSSTWYSILYPLVYRTIILENPPDRPYSLSLASRSLLPSSSSSACSSSSSSSSSVSTILLTKALEAGPFAFPVQSLVDHASQVVSFTQHVPFLEDLLAISSTSSTTSCLLQFRNLAHFETLTLSVEMVSVLKSKAVRQTLKSLVCQSMVYPPSLLRAAVTAFGLGNGGLGMGIFGGGGGGGGGNGAVIELGGAGGGQEEVATAQEAEGEEESSLDRHSTLVHDFWTALKGLSKLRSLELHCASLRVKDLESFLVILQRLERLDLYHTRGEHFVLFTRVWAHGQETAVTVVDTLTMAMHVVQSASAASTATQESEMQQDKTGYLFFPRLRSLTLRSNEADVSIQCEMVKHFPNLEQFTWLAHRNTTLGPISRLFYTSASLPENSSRKINGFLQRLDFSGTDLGDSTLSSILNNLPQLRHLSVERTKFGERCALDLMEREAERKSKEKEGVLDRPAALESIDLRHCHEISSLTIQAMLETFTELKEFKASYLSVKDMVDLVADIGDHGKDRDTRTFHPRSWVCLQLESLDLMICDMAIALDLPPLVDSEDTDPQESNNDSDNGEFSRVVLELGVRSSKSRPTTDSFRSSPASFSSSSSSMARDRARQVFYGQLSRLTRLKHLCLGEYMYTRHAEAAPATAAAIPNSNARRPQNIHKLVRQDPVVDFTLVHGLATLGSLVAMEEFDVRSAEPQMQVQDVQWLVQAWPKLKKIRGRLCPKDREDSVVSYLKMNHPNVRIALHRYI